MKPCRVCGVEKDETNYRLRHKNRRRADGSEYVYEYRPAVCTECEDKQRVEYGRTEAGKASYKRLHEKKWADPSYRAWVKDYWASEAGRAALERYRETDKNTARLARASAKERGLHGSGTLTGEEWREMVTRYQSRCAYCGKTCREDVDPRAHDFLTIDHIVPLTRGGTHSIDNVVPACFRCNIKKGKKRRIPRA